ncbi:MAG: hypothetical protein EAZ32_18755 [Cytophagia bacterium]|nr:MAG: hypothetical protein EAZ38_01395 [Cytophagales bacterium]TAG35147.1 MAG: hypothetical protein EAZ32_18755 [Cytophagia bacterium]TAG75086.1 MAG: hypothetical protein EAZ26_01180 [Runella slithyformis]TAG77080.1 MAG: hypothetical protein EAZ22_16475 [Cytophagales bacterium]
MNRKIVLNLIWTLAFYSSFQNIFAQIPIKANAAIVINISYTPLIGQSSVGGKIYATKDSLFFAATPCDYPNSNALNLLFPCNDHLIKPVHLSFGDIKKIKNRAFLFLIPNRLFIQTKSNQRYLFIIYKRRAIKRLYKSYLAAQTQQPAADNVGQ